RPHCWHLRPDRGQTLSCLSVRQSISHASRRVTASGSCGRARSGTELFPMHERIAYHGITFDDVLLEPGYSEYLPREVDTRTHLTAKIALNLPILSSPMDTVTKAELAIALAQEGGLGL